MAKGYIVKQLETDGHWYGGETHGTLEAAKAEEQLWSEEEEQVFPYIVDEVVQKIRIPKKHKNAFPRYEERIRASVKGNYGFEFDRPYFY